MSTRQERRRQERLEKKQSKGEKMNTTKKPELLSLFSTPIVKINIGRDFTKLETDCFQNISMYKEKERMTNHVSKDRYLFDNTFAEELKDIKEFCESQSKDYLEKIEGADTDIATLRITQSWLNKTKPGEYHLPHYHSNSYLSGVLYISCLPNDGINFENRIHGLFNNMEFLIKKITPWNSDAAKVDVKEGDLLIFRSWVTHGVPPNETKNRERISLAFNTFPIGEMGNDEYANHLKL
jgi:uncharacterized protein (TIGR02466 family)